MSRAQRLRARLGWRRTKQQSRPDDDRSRQRRHNDPFNVWGKRLLADRTGWIRHSENHPSRFADPGIDRVELDLGWAVDVFVYKRDRQGPVIAERRERTETICRGRFTRHGSVAKATS